MTNAESKQQYEGAILNQLIKNTERLVTVETKVSQIDNRLCNVESEVIDVKQKVDYIYKSLKWIIGLLGAIFIAVLANLLSQPLVSLLS